MKRFNIHKPEYMFNTDQSGASFEKMNGPSLWKGVISAGPRLLQNMITTKGNLERVTGINVVSASGKSHKPVVVFHGKLAHYRKIRCRIQALHSVQPHVIYSRETPLVLTLVLCSNGCNDS